MEPAGQLRIPPAQTPSNQALLQIVVLYCGGERATAEALRHAWSLAQGLQAQIRILALFCVPYVLPADQPPVSLAFRAEQMVRVMAAAGVEDTDVLVDVRTCRDECDALRQILPAGSIVVIGGSRWPWLPSRANRIARTLRAAGHHVIRPSLPDRKDPAHA